MADKRNPLAATGETVRANVRRLRESNNLGYAELSRRLKTAGRGIPELGLRRIEEGERRVDSDDLMALAVALDVSPITLLMPLTADAEDVVVVLARTTTAGELWRWLTAESPLATATPSNVFGFIWRSMPAWLLGTEVHLVESGLSPNKEYSVDRRERRLLGPGRGDHEGG